MHGNIYYKAIDETYKIIKEEDEKLKNYKNVCLFISDSIIFLNILLININIFI